MTIEKQILLVNSDQQARTSIKQILNNADYKHITEAEKGSSAIEVLRREPVDILISDIELDELDGWRLSRMVRSDIFCCERGIPIVLVAQTWCERIAETTAREYGINHVLSFENREVLPQILEGLNCKMEQMFRMPSILVIEDNPEASQLVERILKQRFEIDLALDGETGLKKWVEHRHELVLLDVMLPGMSGPEVLQAIFKIRPEQPIVIMTAHSTMERAQELMLAGAADFIAKPFRTEQLRRVCEIASRREDYLISNEQFAERVKSLKESETAYKRISERHQHLLDSLSTVVIELDTDYSICFLSMAWEWLTGHSVESSIGKKLSDFFPDEIDSENEAYQSQIESLISGSQKKCRFELRLFDKNNNHLWVECRFDVMTHKDGKQSISGCIDNITDRMVVQQELEYQAMHDALTGLYNRHYFDMTLTHMVASNERSGAKHALLYIDLDHFKIVNDTLGHHHGDDVLKQIAKLLENRLRDSDILCRIGGDEYAVLLSDTDCNHATKIAKTLCEIVDEYTCIISGQVFEISCSIGICEISGTSHNHDEYLTQADSALYVAKKRGRNQTHVYDSGDQETAELKKTVDWARRIKKAIANDKLVLYSQPVLKISTGAIAYYEILVRLLADDGSIIPPGNFIPALEQAGEMATLDHWVIRQSIALLSDNQQMNSVAINLSAQAFADEHLVPMIEETLDKHAVDAGRITFELTESAGLSNIAATTLMINRLRELGCKFAIDDFGTGFSTFAYIKQLPADVLKIDGSFIRNMDKDPVNLALVKAICDVSRALGKQSVAEFVENEEILVLLKELEVDYAQGYHIGFPEPVNESLQKIITQKVM